MNISGNRILLRAIESKDNDMLLELINDEKTEYLLGGWSFPVSSKNQEDWTNNLTLDKNILRCAIEVNNKAIGVIMLTEIDYKNGNAEIHVKISVNNSRGKGFGTEALNTLTQYAFDELRLKCIYARVSSVNQASQNLFKKCGFVLEGVMKKRIYKKGKYIDLISYSKINEII